MKTLPFRHFFGLLLTVAFALLVVAIAHAQGPAPTTAPAASDGGDSTYGCVESVPKGAQRPMVFDDFPQRGTSGWAATLSITVRHGKGERVLPSGLDLSSAIEAKKVLKQAGFSVPDQDGGGAARIWTEPEDANKPGATTHLELPLLLLPSNPGRNGMILPPLPVAVARANGEIATVCTHGHGILVEDPIANTPNAMPKLNPPGLVQREEWTALKKALAWGSLGLLIGAVLAILLWKQLTKPKPEPPPPPPRPPWELALEELDEVRHAGLLEVNRYGEYFDRTSDAIRRYLGSRFGFDGLESTTDEILASLKKQAGGFIRFDEVVASPDGRPSMGPMPGVSFKRVATFLRDCDLVKFANLTPTPDQCTTSITTGEAIVRGTMPHSMGGPIDDDEPLEAPAVDPVAVAGLRAPFPKAAPPPPTPTRIRSPYEPPDPPNDNDNEDAPDTDKDVTSASPNTPKMPGAPPRPEEEDKE